MSAIERVAEAFDSGRERQRREDEEEISRLKAENDYLRAEKDKDAALIGELVQTITTAKGLMGEISASCRVSYEQHLAQSVEWALAIALARAKEAGYE